MSEQFQGSRSARFNASLIEVNCAGCGKVILAPKAMVVPGRLFRCETCADAAALKENRK